MPRQSLSAYNLAWSQDVDCWPATLGRRKDWAMLSFLWKRWCKRGIALPLFVLGMTLGAPVQLMPGLPDVAATPAPDSGQLETPREAQVGVAMQQEEHFPAEITAKQKRDLLKQNLEKMKQDAEELAALAKALEEELGKSNANVLSLKVVEKAEKIEKLAKRIKSTARGF